MVESNEDSVLLHYSVFLASTSWYQSTNIKISCIRYRPHLFRTMSRQRALKSPPAK